MTENNPFFLWQAGGKVLGGLVEAGVAEARAAVHRGADTHPVMALGMQLAGLAEDMVSGARADPALLFDLIQLEVDRSVSRLGLATSAEIMALREQVSALQRQVSELGGVDTQVDPGSAPARPTREGEARSGSWQAEPGQPAPESELTPVGPGTARQPAPPDPGDPGAASEVAPGRSVTNPPFRPRRSAPVPGMTEVVPVSDRTGQAASSRKPRKPAAKKTTTKSTGRKPGSKKAAGRTKAAPKVTSADRTGVTVEAATTERKAGAGATGTERRRRAGGSKNRAGTRTREDKEALS